MGPSVRQLSCVTLSGSPQLSVPPLPVLYEGSVAEPGTQWAVPFVTTVSWGPGAHQGGLAVKGALLGWGCSATIKGPRAHLGSTLERVWEGHPEGWQLLCPGRGCHGAEAGGSWDLERGRPSVSLG